MYATEQEAIDAGTADTTMMLESGFAVVYDRQSRPQPYHAVSAALYEVMKGKLDNDPCMDFVSAHTLDPLDAPEQLDPEERVHIL